MNATTTAMIALTAGDRPLLFGPDEDAGDTVAGVDVGSEGPRSVLPTPEEIPLGEFMGSPAGTLPFGIVETGVIESLSSAGDDCPVAGLVGERF